MVISTTSLGVITITGFQLVTVVSEHVLAHGSLMQLAAQMCDCLSHTLLGHVFALTQKCSHKSVGWEVKLQICFVFFFAMHMYMIFMSDTLSPSDIVIIIVAFMCWHVTHIVSHTWDAEHV